MIRSEIILYAIYPKPIIEIPVIPIGVLNKLNTLFVTRIVL